MECVVRHYTTECVVLALQIIGRHSIRAPLFGMFCTPPHEAIVYCIAVFVMDVFDMQPRTHRNITSGTTHGPSLCPDSKKIMLNIPSHGCATL